MNLHITAIKREFRFMAVILDNSRRYTSHQEERIMEKEVYSQSICLMNEVVELYHMSSLNMLEIANELSISKSTVSRILKQANQCGIMELKIKEPYLECMELQKELLEKYPIKKIYVVPIAEEKNDALAIKKSVAKEGARYLQRILSNNQMLGLAWGGTMHHMIQYLNPCRKKNTGIITMHGDLTECGDEYNVRNLVRRAAMAFGGKKYILEVSGYAKDEEMAWKIRRHKSYREFVKYFEEISISVTGAGAWKPFTISTLSPSKFGYISDREFQELERKNVTADFLLHFIDEDGNEIDSEIKKRTISIDLELYKQIPHKIVLLSGTGKVYAAKGILKGGYADILFLDYYLAKELHDL